MRKTFGEDRTYGSEDMTADIYRKTHTYTHTERERDRHAKSQYSAPLWGPSNDGFCPIESDKMHHASISRPGESCCIFVLLAVRHAVLVEYSMLRPPPVGQCSFVIDSVCGYVCPRVYLRNRISKLHQIFCACYLRPWLGLPWLRCNMYFRYCG